jgi:hypothetical protein
MRGKYVHDLGMWVASMAASVVLAGSAWAQPCVSSAQCDDDNECTQNRCIDNNCVFPNRQIGIDCGSDGNDCTRDQCLVSPSGGGLTCQHVAVSPGSQCSDDGNDCTRDQCLFGDTGITCQHNPLPFGSECADEGNDCTFDQCFPDATSGIVSCQHAPAPFGSPCGDDGNDCTWDRCRPVNGSSICQHEAMPYGSACTDDGNDCTLDTCLPDAESVLCQHQPLPPGSACDDGTPCTQGDACNSSGSCIATAPPQECRGSVKANLILKSGARDADDVITYQWLQGEVLENFELGDPTATTDYTLCLFDGTGLLQLSASVPAGGSCDGNDCWRARPKGYKYTDPLRRAAGITKIKLSSGEAGKSGAQVVGKGAALGLPPLPLTPPVRAQLINDETGVCVGSLFSTAAINNEKRFKARYP